MATTLDQQSQERQSPDVLSRALAQVYTLNWEAIAYVVIFIAAIFTRFYMLGERVMSHDESLHTRYSYNLATEGNFQHTPLMHGPVLFHITALFYFLFGANDFTSRLYPAILGVVVVMMPLLFRRWLGRWGALLASIMLLVSPITMYYNRYIRHDTPNIFFSLVMIYGMFMYLAGPQNQRQRAHWLYIIAGAMVLNLGSKETAFIYIAIFGIYLALYWFVRLLQYFMSVPGKTTFYSIIMAFGVGGVAALGMYVTLSINMGEQPFFEAISTLTSPTTFIMWTLVVIAFIGIFTGATVVNGFRGGRTHLSLREGLSFFGLSFLFSTVLIILEEISRIPSDDGGEAVATVSQLPVIAAWGVAALAIGVMIVTWRRGYWDLMKKEFPEFDLLILIGSLILPWAAPFIIKFAGVSMKVSDINAYTVQEYQIVGASLFATFAISITAGLLWDWKKWLISNAIFYALFAFFFTTMFTNGNGIATGIVGSLGYWLEQQGVRRGNQPQYYYLGVILPMYEYLPMIGSLFAMFGGLTWFWRFRRNRIEEEQPEPLAHSTDETSAVDATNDDTDEHDFNELPPSETRENMQHVYGVRSSETLTALPFLPFLAWWAILNLIGYTLAGEKMPWLAIHLTLPMILLTGWFFGRIFDKVNLKKFLNLGWLYLLLLPLAFVLVARMIGPFLFGNVPFSDLQVESLQESGEWFAVVLVLGVVIAGLVYLVQRTGVDHLRRMTAVALFSVLALLSLRSAWMASFINFDLANEYLVYAHAAPAVKLVLNDIEDLSRRSTDGLDLTFVYDNEVSWPYSWYFREFNNARFVGSSPNAQQIDEAVVAVVGEANRAKFEPLLEDRFYRREYIRLWWPMQDYFNMTPQRLSESFNFADPSSALVRQGLWDIWWQRDYTTYGNATDRNFALTGWPVADRMHFYVRKDFAAQIWDLGVGEGTVPGLEAVEVNVCNANWQPIRAEQIFGDNPATGQVLLNPIGISVQDGRVYLAEQGGHQISIFDTEGNFVESFGQQGSALDPTTGAIINDETTFGVLERPNSVGVSAEGNIYVADTWNFRVQVFSPEGEVIDAWGSRHERGAEAQTEPFDGFWGPRDVLVADGRVYVADTGNKRIRVYDTAGEYLFDVGSAGSADGQLNEPAGLAYHPDGRLFVADTWNRRISVFAADTGEFLYNFRVRAWYNDRGNRPYLAVDPERNYLYVTDPEAARVLIYDIEGNCLGSFGQPAVEGNIADNQFQIAAGLAVDENGNVFVVDSGTGRVLRFASFPPPDPEIMEEIAPGAVGGGQGGVDSVDEELSLEQERPDDNSAAQDEASPVEEEQQSSNNDNSGAVEIPLDVGGNNPPGETQELEPNE